MLICNTELNSLLQFFFRKKGVQLCIFMENVALFLTVANLNHYLISYREGIYENQIGIVFSTHDSVHVM